MVLFKSQRDVETASRALFCRKEELKSSIATVLDFLAPEANRRTGQMRRLGIDRRAQRSGADSERRGSDRRSARDRRLPPYQHLRVLRGELEQVLRLQDLVGEWQVSLAA